MTSVTMSAKQKKHVIFKEKLMDLFTGAMIVGAIGSVIYGICKHASSDEDNVGSTSSAPSGESSHGIDLDNKSHFGDLLCAPGDAKKTAPALSAHPVKSAPKGGWLDACADDDSCSEDVRDNGFTPFDCSGKTAVCLGAKNEEASGGEGTVYSIPDHPDHLVKIYKAEILKDEAKRQELEDRILSMCKMWPSLSHKMREYLAWPLMPLYDGPDPHRRRFIGFVMKKCNGVSLRCMCGGVKSVQRHFPGYPFISRADLAQIASDFVNKVNCMASRGIFINDFNPANFLVRNNRGRYEVMFIDCDSYQVPKADGRGVHVTRTYFASMVAPELLRNKQLLAMPRGIHQVEFGAAMVAFQIVMCGLSPYSYFDPTRHAGCGTPDENLLKGNCPLGTGNHLLLPKGNWYNLWSWLTYELKSCFITMFKDGHANPASRPDLETLRKGLDKFRMVATTVDCQPDRNSLTPQSAKPRQSSSFYAA